MNAPKDNAHHLVAVLGASLKPDRYSNLAIRSLVEHGYTAIPIHPAHEEIEGLPVASRLESIEDHVDTLTVYVGPRNLFPLIDEIVALRPGRVILNPGTESPELKERLREADIPYLEACTLVMLSTGRFGTNVDRLGVTVG